MLQIDAPPLAPPPGSAGPRTGGAAPHTPALLALGRRPRCFVRDLVRLARPGQWPKNLLVVPLALLDPGRLTAGGLVRIGWAVALFTLASSLVYAWNDLADRQRDRMHPTKRSRPIAAGRIGVGVGYAYVAALAALLALAISVAPSVGWWPVLAYLALNAAYSRWLKHVPPLDVFTVAAGFVLRAVQGYLAVGAPISTWLLVSVFSLCLLLVLGKRRHEVSVAGSEHRPSLRGYSTQYLDCLLVLSAVVTITAFLLYLDEGRVAAPYSSAALMVSVPCAMFAIARYLQVVVVHRGGGDPVRTLLRDPALLATSLLWTALLAATMAAAHFPALVELLN
jgi:decaprenyl-phosphate phosphoribosyltransferase